MKFGNIPLALAIPITVITGGYYVQAIGTQGDLDQPAVWLFASCIFGSAVAMLFAISIPDARRVYLGTGAATALLFTGVLGLFSIGMPLVVASALAVAGTLFAARGGAARPVVAGATSLLVLATATACFIAAVSLRT